MLHCNMRQAGGLAGWRAGGLADRLDRHQVDPRRAAMFEDLAKNLVVPAALGMTTTLVLPKVHDPFREAHEQAAVTAPYVHHTTTDLAGFLRQLMPRLPAA